jgi:hypothetical protein
VNTWRTAAAVLYHRARRADPGDRAHGHQQQLQGRSCGGGRGGVRQLGAIADTIRARRHPDEPPAPRTAPAPTPDRRDDELLAGNWIWASNLRRFLELVSSYIGYRFDHPDWQAIMASPDTFTSGNDTFSYPLTGQPALTLTINKNPGSNKVLVQITGPQDRLLGARIAALTDAFQ